MAKYISDEEVFGTPSNPSNYVSDEEVFGTASAEKKRERRKSEASAVDYVRAVDSGVAQGVANIGAGVGTFIQDPAANTLAGVVGAAHLADRGLTWLMNKAGANAEVNTELQENARMASRFAADSRAAQANDPTNLPARLGRFMEQDSRRVIEDIKAKERENNPELIRQQENMGKAEGFGDNIAAAIDNPLALTNTLARSGPDMALGVGVGSVLKRAGAGMGAVSTAGTLSEAGSSAMQAREGTYQQVVGIPIEALAARSPRFKEILAETGGNAVRAREILANELADQTPILSGAGTAAGTVLTNRLFGGDATAKSIMGADKMTAKELGKRITQDTVEEGFQGVPEDAVQFGATVQADQSKEFDPGGALAQNMVAGFAMGTGGHGFAYGNEKLAAMRGGTKLGEPTPTPPPVQPNADATVAAAPAAAPAQPTQTAAPAAPGAPAADPVARLAELEIISEQRDLTPGEQQEIVTLQARLNDEQDVPQGTQGTNGALTNEGASTQAAPDQAAENSAGNAPAAGGVPAAGGNADVQAAGVSGEFADLFDEQGRPKFSNAQSVKDFKERTGLGQDGVRAIQAAIQEGRPITVDEARQADLAGQERRKAALEQSKAESEAEAQAAKQNSAKPTEPSKVLGDYEIPGIEGATNRVRVLQRGGRIEAIGLDEGTAHNDLSRLIQSGQSVEQALATLYGDHGPNEAPNPSRVKRAGQPTSDAPILPPLEAPQDVNMQNRDRGRAASVVQMSDIARNPDYMRLGPSRTPDSGAPMVFAVGDDLKDIAPDAYGREDVAVMSDGQRVPFRYAVVDATKVNPSNFADGRRNELFDSTVPGTLKALNNGRTAGIRGAHELGTAGEYVQAMQTDTPLHGISPDIIARTPNAALVRVYSDSDNTAGMAAKSQGQGLGMSPAELARQDAPLMDSSVLAVYQPGEVTSAANRDFVRAFIGKLQGAGQDVAGMMTADGQLSQDGRKRIQAALMQAAYGDSDIVEEMFDSTDTDIKAIGEALKTVAGQWANMRDSARLNAINPQADITDNLLQAIGLIRKARRDGMSLYDLVNQPDLMTGETPAEMTVGMLRLFYSGQYLTRAIGKEKLTQHLADYVQGAMTTSADAGMFGDVVTAWDILATIINRLNEGQGNAEAQPQEGRGQPAGSVDTGRGTGEGQPGIGGQAAGEGGPGSNQDRGGQPGQNAQAQSQQQDGQGNQGSQEGDGAQAAAAPGGQRGEPEAQAAGVKAEKPKKAAKPKTAKAPKPEAMPSDATQQLERDFRTFPTQILNNLLERGEAAKLYKAAGVNGSSAFDGLAMDDKAAAYVKYVEQGGKPVGGLPKDYNAWAASQERDAVARRLRSDRVVRQENGKPFKSKISAQQFQERYDLTGTHEVVQAAGGFELRQLSIAAQAELKRKAEGRENYTEAQAAVAAEMGIGVNEDGEWDVTDAQFDELERRTAARLKGEKAAPPTEPEPLLTAQTPEEIVARQDAAEAAKREQEAADRKAREQERQAEERKRIAQASERAADNFELGQDPLDSLTGQTNIFDTPAEAPAPATAVSANTVFTEDAAAKARERLKKKLGRLNSGIDPEMMIDGITLAGYHIEKGARTFAAYASAMLADLGDGVRPYLKSWYMGVKYDPRAASLDGMDSAAAVESADVDAITAQENQDAAGANGSVEPDRGDAAAEPAMGDAVPADARGAARPAGQAGGQATGEGRGRQPRGAGVPTGGPAAGGNRGDFLLPGGNAAADAANVSAGSDFSERGSDIGVDGVSTDPIPAAQVNAVAQTGNDKLSKLERQRAAEKVPVKPGDLDNIKATLPYLLAGQQEDVKKAEDRFAVPDGYGMLFTNGTGTGKTFTGLGVVKRMQRQGKTNTLIVVPDDKIAADWVESGEPLGLKITKLKDTQDAGKGIVITTYANLGENDALARRQWDLVVADESHTLMQSADGKVTTYLANLRAITHHPDGASQRHTMLNRDDLNRQRDLTARIEGNNKILNNLDTMDAMMESVRQENAKLQREADALAAKLREAREAVQAEVEGMQGAKRARLLALSATPFAYEFTVDWANGYLFDYNEGQPSDKTESRGYNQGDNRERFFMQHFGYSMRYNKLTKPDPTKVDTGLLQRNFNGWLRKKGSLSARMLDVPADYDRRFVLVDSGIGNQIDEALNWVSEMAREDANKNGYSALRDVISKKFDFLSRRYLLEAIKATEVIPIVRQHLALGRKVVVFHDYKKGGGFNPFDIEVPRTLPEDFPEERKADFEAYKEALTEFRSRFKRLVNAPLSDLDSPIEVFKRELPDTMLVNGDEKKADLLERYKRFQDDASGPQVMLVQSAKNKGWSGHDTTGKHQRVLINLGQPTAPTLAIQQEGRIYRTGQVSDAIMRYLNTGTNWEKWTFATTIAGRASTAENLGMGEQARALKDSFISAFEESDTYEPGHEGEGKGGKERDQMANAAITAYDRAKTYYWATQKKNSKTKAQEGVDYFATPEPVGFKMAEWLGLRGGESSLEPSAGHGAIARWLPEISNRTVIEPSTTLRARLAMAMDASKDRIIDGTFEDHNIVNKYDGIAMNPPFGAGGKTAIEHLAKAVTHLRDGGRIAALIPTGPAADKRFDQWMYGETERLSKPIYKHPTLGEIHRGDTVTVEFMGRAIDVVADRVDRAASGDFLRAPGEDRFAGKPLTLAKSIKPGPRVEKFRPADGIYMVAEIKLPQVTFERAGTAVATRIVILEKQSNKDKAPNARPAIDLSDIQDIGQLFDEIEDISMPPRAMSAEQEAAAQAEREQADREAKKAERAQAKAEGKPKTPKAANPDAVGTVDRGDAEIITHTTGKGKVLRGIVRTDMLKEEAQKIDPFTFRKDGGWFIRDVYLKPEGGGDAPAAYSTTGRSIPLAASQRVVEATVAQEIEQRIGKFAHQPAVVIRESAEGVLPGATKANGVAGAVHKGRIYLFLDQLATRGDVQETLFHELFHYGVRKIFTRDQFIQEMRNLYERDAWVKDRADAWVKTEEGASAAQYGGAEYALARGVDEALARLAEPNAGVYTRTDAISRAMVRVTRWLADVAQRWGFNQYAAKLRGIKNEEARALVQRVFQTLETQEYPEHAGWMDDSEPAFSRSTLGNAPAAPPKNPTPLQKLKAKALQLTSPEAITSLIYEFQDKNIDLKRLRDHIKELGGTITDLNDAYLGEELYHKRVAKRTQDFLSEELKPLLADLRARGLDLPTLEQFLHARHAPEANKVLAERNPNAQMIDAGRNQAQQAVRALEVQLQRAKAQGTATKAIEDALTEAREEASRWEGGQAFKGTEDERTSLSGMSDAAAKAFMDGLQPGQRVHLDALAARVDAINAKTLDTLEKYGLMDKASMDAWRNTYQHYVPLHRDEAHPDAVSHPIGQGFSTKGAASKRRTGSNEKVTNILAHIAMQRESALTRGEKNRVAKKLYLMAAQNPDPEVWAVDKPPMTKTVDSETGFVRTTVDPTYKNKPNVVMVRISGKDQAVVFNERNPEAVRLAQSIKSADLGELNAFDSLMGKATRWLASVNTQYNPIFGLINFARDVQAAMLQLSTTPLRGQERAVAANVPAALRGIYAEVRARRAGAGRGTGDWAKLWEEMQDEGGTTGYRELFIDPAERVKALNKEIKSLERGQASELAHAVVDWLSDYNETMENAVRLSAYKAALDQGMSKERAASLAKNLTVNFNRRGRQTAKLGAYYAFLNAAIQGSTRMVETLRGPVGKKIMLGGVMLGAVNTLIAMTMMGAGEDDDNWAKIPDFVKERSVIVPLGREDYLAIPMPLGYHVLPNMGRKAIEMMLHNDPTVGAGKHVADMAKLVLDAFNPLGGSGNVAQMIAPTPIDPAVALMMNRDWTGKPIYREDSSSLDPTPGHTRTKDTASTFSKVVSEAIVKVTGGSDYQPGAVNWTPDQLDYVIGQLTGGLGRELMKVEQTATAPFTGDELPPYKIPLVGRVYGNTRGPASESDKFYENLTKLNGVEREIKGRARDDAGVDDYMATEPLSDLVGLGNSAQNQISKLRQVRREVVRQGLPGYQSEVKELNQQIGDVMKTVNQEVRRAKLEAAK